MPPVLMFLAERRVVYLHPVPRFSLLLTKSCFPHFPPPALFDSDNLSAPLCLFPARSGDLSLISAAAAIAPPPEPSSGSDASSRTSTNGLKKSHSRLSVSTESFDRGGVVCDNGAGAGHGGSNDVDGRSTGLSGMFGGDVGRLWMSEDGGYLCIDLLLERTLEELAEGLAFAAR